MATSSRHAVALKPFTVDVDAALPLDVCCSDGVKAALGLSTSLRGGNVVPAGVGATAPTPRFKPSTARRERPQVLDGFRLLEASGVELPEDSTSATVESKGLTELVAQDLCYFVNLAVLNLGDNKLGSFADFHLVSYIGSCLPNLVELRLHCNGITNIKPLQPLPVQVLADGTVDAAAATGPLFPKLEVLDLSYNAVAPSSIAALSFMPMLRELDLTCNTLEDLPDMSGFRRLEVLVLQRNRLASDDHLVTLSQCPKLRELNLSFNYLARIPKDAVGSRRRFPYLEWLDLSNNYFSAEQDLLFLVKIPTLQQAVLFGNPVTFRAKQSGRQPGEAPPPALAPPDAKEGAAAELALVAVEEEHVKGKVVNLVTDDPSAGARRGRAQGTYSNFRVTKVTEKPLPSNAEWREAGNRFLFADGDSSSDDDDVEVGAGGGRARAGAGAAPEADSDDNDDDTAGDDDDDGDDGGGVVPATFITSGAGLPPEEQGDPVQLRAALTSLRHLLKHPLTDDRDDEVKDKAYLKTTASMKSRRVPLRPYKPKAERTTAAGARHAPVAAAAAVVRGPPGSTHPETRPMLGSSLRRRPAGASAASVGAGSSRRVDKVLQATEDAKASVDAMEAALADLMSGGTGAPPPTRSIDQAMGGFLASMDNTLRNF